MASDLHLTDGTSGETISDGAFEIFADELSLLATSASKRQDGAFKPLDVVDVLLLGDILDVIRSTRWHETTARPWSHPEEMAPMVQAIVGNILTRNAPALQHLRRLNGLVPVVPPGGGDVVEVPLRLHMMVGNHDWMLHLPGPAFDAVRQQVIDALGLSAVSHRADRPFAHDLDDGTVGGPRDDGGELDAILAAHRVHARHGDVFDPFNYVADFGRNASSLGDAMVIELLNAFPGAVQRRLGLAADDELVLGLKELDNVRPLLLIPTWLLSLLRRLEAKGRTGIEAEVMKVWRDAAEHLLEVPFVRSLDKPFRFDVVDQLQLMLLGAKSGAVLDAVSRCPPWLARLMVGEHESYANNGADERALREGRRDYAVTGHTHHAEVVPLGRLHPGADMQFAMNAGTWRCVHERCVRDGQVSFAASHVMTWLAFFKDGERKGRRHESWSGQLDRGLAIG